jgi:hypothetical protein
MHEEHLCDEEKANTNWHHEVNRNMATFEKGLKMRDYLTD